MADDVKYRRLSVDGTLNAGLSIIIVTFLIMLLCGSFVALAFMLQENTESATEFTCNSGETVEAEWVQDGTSDCVDGSDETEAAEEEIAGEKTFGFLSYIMFGIAGVVLVSGILGLSTKILADSISAGLALHAANEALNPDIEVKVLPTQVAPVQVAQSAQATTPQQHQQPTAQQHTQQVVHQPLPPPQNPHQ
ncbi:MAG: hypothetical protein QGH90_07175 [Candidatus Poseidoniaceae archaeon]|jgi:hypothetical protein|nr:hypothetical protein [Candidatus Poseidoniaceae archaeon]